MARKRLEDTTARLESWDDVNDALREICRLQIDIEATEGMMQEEITRIKQEAELTVKPMQEMVKALEADIKVFCEEHRGDLGKAKSKVMNFGTIGFRQSTKIIIKKAKAVIDALKSRGMLDCIRVKEEIDKERLAEYSDAEIAAVGAKKQTQDTFWYEVDRERLEAV